MLPASSIVLAALRWVGLLRVCSVDQASSAIRSNASYTDLTQTQYASGFELLKNISFISDSRLGDLGLRGDIQAVPDDEIRQLLFERVLVRAVPAWLQDADVLITAPDEIPQDADSLAQTLNLKSESAFLAIGNARGKVDSSERSRVGLAGELALIDLLEREWPGSTFHVSQVSDGFGYDIVFRHENLDLHLEVKATTRRGRLVIHLSRHEQEVGQYDRNWHLVVVGLNDDLQIEAVATVKHRALWQRAPRDVCSEAKWESAVHEIGLTDLEPGLAFITGPAPRIETARLHFVWMPV